MKKNLFILMLLIGIEFSENYIYGTQDNQANDDQQCSVSTQMNSYEIAPYQLIIESGLSKMSSRMVRQSDCIEECIQISASRRQSLSKAKGEVYFTAKDMGKKPVCLSLEVLLNVYKTQLRVEFAALDREATGSLYCYTDDPPSIFATAIGGEAGVQILNRVKALAIRELLLNDPNFARYLKVYAFNDYADQDMPAILRHVLSRRMIKALSKRSIFCCSYLDRSGYYSGVRNNPFGLTLVLHNNGGAFGQNIENEAASSLDGLIGSYSTAAFVVDRKREDLFHKIFPLSNNPK